jgi:Mn2+/Fe2+ NRAMP family transporter
MTSATTSGETDLEYARPFDPYALDPAQIQDPPSRLGHALRQVGPGLILAGAIVGTGELIATTNVGAKVGFTLLWLVIISCFIKVFVQVELGRYAISSGQTTMQGFARLPGPGMVFVWWIVLMTLVTQFQLGAMIGGVGQALHMTFPGVSGWIGGFMPYVAGRPEMPWAVLTTVATILLLANGSYSFVEKGTTVMVVLFTLVTVACVLLLPAAGHPIVWSEVASGLTFQLPASPDARMAAFAMFGITGVGAAELVAYPYWCIEKGYARKAGPRELEGGWIERARGWLSVMKLDAWVSMGVYTLATLAFFFLGASVLHTGDGTGLPGSVNDMLDRLAHMYQPVMGERAALVFIVVGAFAVLYSTLFASTAANARGFTDALWVSRLIDLRDHGSRRRWIVAFCVLTPILDLLLYVTFGNPVQMVIIGGFAQAVTLPMIAAAAVFLRYRRTDQRLTAGKVWDAFLWVSFVALCGAAAYGLYDVYGKVMKVMNGG